MTSRCLRLLLLATTLAGCDGQLAHGTATTKVDASSPLGLDAGFVCTPPAAASEPGFTFSGTLFDSTGGCLSGSPIALPVCGCFGHTGHDTSTWCFARPDGTAYFTTSPDECDVQMPPGWYATQTMGPAPSGTPNAAQAAACTDIAKTSTVRATYDRLGPPACPAAAAPMSDAAAPSTEAGVCVVPPNADTFSDASASGCRPVIPGLLCAVSNAPDGGLSGGTETCSSMCSAGQFELACSVGGPGGSGIPSPDTSLGCSSLDLPTPPNEASYCCACGS